jgi:hypothetical protein
VQFHTHTTLDVPGGILHPNNIRHDAENPHPDPRRRQRRDPIRQRPDDDSA